MSEDNNNEVSTEETKSEGLDTNQLSTLQAELNEAKALIKNLRKYEKSYKEENQKALEEQGKFKELYETEQQRTNSLLEKLKNTQVEGVLNDLIKQSGAKNSNTVKRLFDKSQFEFTEEGLVKTSSIEAQLAQIQKDAPELFGISKDKTPNPAKVGDETPSSGYEIEIVKCKTQSEIIAVMQKYGKL